MRCPVCGTRRAFAGPVRVALRVVCMGLCLQVGTALHAQTFSDFLERVNNAPEGQRMSIVDSFVSANAVTPVIEFDTLAHFYYRAFVSAVSVPGDANGWNPASAPMSKLSSTDFWYRTETYPPDARLDYKFVIGTSNWILDPRNPYQCSGGYGPNSELRMPQYVPAPEILYYAGIPHGTLRDTTMFSVNLGNSRTVRVYLPPGYDPAGPPYPMMLFHDGLEYITLAQANNVLDYLTYHQRITPVVGVFVPPVNRTEEYAGSKMSQFSLFIVNELLPYIESRYNVRKDSASRAVLGASNGGNISLWLGLNYPQVFGNIAAQSSNVVSSISSGFQYGPKLDLRFYLDLGTYDIAVLIPMVRNFAGILSSKGYDYQYVEYNEGHSWGNWRAHIDNALEMFFPAPPTSVSQGVPERGSATLFQNYPNPFNPKTEIVLDVPASGWVRLVVYDPVGREVARLVDGPLEVGRHTVSFDASGLGSGVYLCRMTTGGIVRTRAMLLVR